MHARGYFVLLAALAIAACEASEADAPPIAHAGVDAAVDVTPATDAGFAWNAPSGFPLPPVPVDNPMTPEKVELGRRLFYDKRLSVDGTYACATCHEQAKAFTDGRAQSIGVTGKPHPRGATSLANVGYLATLTWESPLVTQLERQALLPMFNDNPPELGLAGQEDALLARLQGDSVRFEAAFPGAMPAVSIDTITKAIAAFERTIMSGHSAYDRYLVEHDDTAMSDAAKRGMGIFFSETGDCYHCHGGFNFTDSVVRADSPFSESTFHNTGLYNIDGKGGYPITDRGLIDLTGNPSDMGKFRAPSLRNVALTAPYMHDGSVATLEDVVELYSQGGRGDGTTNPFKDSLIRVLPLSAGDKSDLVEFLKSLTDDTLTSEPRYGPP